MKSSKGQLTAILILIIALFMQIEGLIPDGLISNIFASSEDPIILSDEIEGVEIKAEIDGKGFNNEKEVIIKATVTNNSRLSFNYYSETKSYGYKEIIGAALKSIDGKSSFTDKLIKEEGFPSIDMVLEGELEPGRTLTHEFRMLPFYKENGSVKHVSEGQYILCIWYNKGIGEITKAEFPIKVVKRFGRMYIKM
jgi:hypothetical protein